MESILAALHINFKVMFTQLVGFVILFWLLRKFLFGPVCDMIKKRASDIQAGYDKNEKGEKEVNRLKTDYERKLSALKAEGEKIISEGRSTAEKVKEEIIAKAKSEAEDIINVAHKKVEEERQRVLVQLHDGIADISVSIASKLISRSINKEDHKQFINEYLTQMEEVYGNN